MKSGEIDAIESVPPTAIDTLKKAGVIVVHVPGVTTNDFIFNANTKKTNHRELLNLKLREAFAHAIDRDKIIKVAWLGTAKPATSFIPPATGDWHNPNLKPETFDLAKANQLLDGLGYKKGSGRDPDRRRAQDVVRGDRAERLSRASTAPSRSSRPTSTRSAWS